MDKYTEIHQRLTEWMELCRGLRSHHVAAILNRHDNSGVSWTRCNKTEMAQLWVDLHNGGEDRVVDVDALRKELQDAPRKPRIRKKSEPKEDLREPEAPTDTPEPLEDLREPESSAEKAPAPEDARQIGDIEALMYQAFSCEGSREKLVETLFEAAPSIDQIQQLHNRWETRKTELEHQLASLRRELCRVVYLDKVAQQAIDALHER